MPAKQGKNIKFDGRIFIASFMCGIAFWIADTAMDYYLYYKDEISFIDSITPAHEIYMRSIVFVVFLLSGFILSIIFTKIRRANLELVELKESLTVRVKELEDALSKIKQLQGLLPICSYCKKIRNDQNYWQQVESYVTQYTGAMFSHGICPECYERVVKPEIAEYSSRKKREEGQP